MKQKNVTTLGSLDKDQLRTAEQLASGYRIATTADILGIGAEVHKLIQALDPRVDALLMKDLGPIGDLFTAMESQMGTIKPEDVLHAEPTWLDRIIEQIGILRQNWGILARFIKRYQTVSEAVLATRKQLSEALDGLVDDVTGKERIISQYQGFEIDLLVWARVAEIKRDEFDVEWKGLRKKTGKTNADNNRITELDGFIQICAQRANNLITASTIVKQQWVAMDVSKKSEWSLIEKTDSSQKLDEALWRQAARAVASALRMTRAAELVTHIQEFTEAILLETSELQKLASNQSASVGSRAIAGLALLQKVNQNILETLSMQRQIFSESQGMMEEADRSLFQLRNDLDLALGGEDVEPAALPAETQSTK